MSDLRWDQNANTLNEINKLKIGEEKWMVTVEGMGKTFRGRLILLRQNRKRNQSRHTPLIFYRVVTTIPVNPDVGETNTPILNAYYV